MAGNLTGTRCRDEIAKEAGVDLEAVIIDVPTVPSVPYHHAVLMESTEIPVFTRSPAGEKKLQRLSESSKIFETLKGFMNILRVYTDASTTAKKWRKPPRKCWAKFLQPPKSLLNTERCVLNTSHTLGG